MSTVIEWDNMDIRVIEPTYLSFADGYIYQVDDLVLNDFENEGIRLQRLYINEKGIIRPLMEKPALIVAPEDLIHVKRVEHNGWTRLITDKYGNLVNPGFKAETEDDELEQVQTRIIREIINPETGEIVEVASTAESSEELLFEQLDSVFGIETLPADDQESADIMASMQESKELLEDLYGDEYDDEY